MKTPLMAVLLALVVAPVGAEPGSLAHCQQLKSRIDYYTDKRRAGGSGASMQSWKRARQETLREFKRNRCRRYGARLT